MDNFQPMVLNKNLGWPNKRWTCEVLSMILKRFEVFPIKMAKPDLVWWLPMNWKWIYDHRQMDCKGHETSQDWGFWWNVQRLRRLIFFLWESWIPISRCIAPNANGKWNLCIIGEQNYAKILKLDWNWQDGSKILKRKTVKKITKSNFWKFWTLPMANNILSKCFWTNCPSGPPKADTIHLEMKGKDPLSLNPNLILTPDWP